MRNVAVGCRPAQRAGLGLVISACLAVALLLATAGAARAISGYSTGGPAVAAQYPDSGTLRQSGPKPVFSDLGEVTVHIRTMLRNSTPEARRQVRAKERSIVRKTTHAIATAAGLDPSQSGSIALLAAAMGVIVIGGFLRWRRGVTPA
jgi:hypothetical protein